jgi:hypothetical protein
MKRKRSEISELRKSLAFYKQELKASYTRHDVTKADREKFRSFFVAEMRRQIEAQGRGQYYGPQAMIERLAKFLGGVESWYWG